MEWKQKEHKIEFDERAGTFFCKELGIALKPSLDSVKKEIDKISKQQIKETKAYDYAHYTNRLKEVTITSIDNDNYFWIKDEKAIRSKEHILFKINEHNRKLFSEITELKKDIKKREDKIDKLQDQLQHLKIEDIKKESKEQD